MAAKKKSKVVKKGRPAKSKIAASTVSKAKVKAPAAKLSAASVASLLTPLDDRLVVAIDPMAERTTGGIIIPGTVAGRQSRGRVLAKGRGKRNKKGSLRPLDVSVGDHIMFAEFSGTTVNLAGSEVLILREEDVLGIVL